MMKAKRLRFPAIRQSEWELFDASDADTYTVIAETSKSLISTGTELALYAGTHIGFSIPNPPSWLKMPLYPGYALVGRVTDVGDAVSDIQIGQRVLMEVPHGSVAVEDIRTQKVFPIPDALGDEEATLLRLAYIAMTAPRLCPLQLGESVVVYGLGLVGQLAAQLFAANGAHPIIGVDRIEERLAIAGANGITTLHSDQVNVPEAIMQLTNGRGADVVIEATGSPAVLPLALEAAAVGARVVQLGSTRGEVKLDIYSQIHRKGIQLLGAHETAQRLDMTTSTRWTKGENLQLLANLFIAGKLRSEGLIGRVISPDQALTIHEELMVEPQLGVLIDWGG